MMLPWAYSPLALSPVHSDTWEDGGCKQVGGKKVDALKPADSVVKGSVIR